MLIRKLIKTIRRESLLRLPLLLLSAVASVGLAAGELSYTNIAVGHTSLEALDEDYSGVTISGSLQFDENAYLFASTNDATSDDTIAGKERDNKTTRVGAGLILPLTERLDINLSVAFHNQDGDDAIGVIDGDGFAVAYGMRGRVGKRFEIGGSVAHVSAEEKSNSEATLYGRYFLRSAVSLGGSVYGDVFSGDNRGGYAFDARVDF